MFSILPLNLFSLLGLNTVALQSLPDDSSNQASQSLITAALQQLCTDTLFCKMAESPWIQPRLKLSKRELLQSLLHFTHLCGHTMTNPVPHSSLAHSQGRYLMPGAAPAVSQLGWWDRPWLPGPALPMPGELWAPVCPDTHTCDQNEGVKHTKQEPERWSYFLTVLVLSP